MCHMQVPKCITCKCITCKCITCRCITCVHLMQVTYIHHMQVHNVSSITMCCTTTTIDNVRSNVNALLQAASFTLTCKAQQNGPVQWVVLCRL